MTIRQHVRRCLCARGWRIKRFFMESLLQNEHDSVDPGTGQAVASRGTWWNPFRRRTGYSCEVRWIEHVVSQAEGNDTGNWIKSFLDRRNKRGCACGCVANNFLKKCACTCARVFTSAQLSAAWRPQPARCQTLGNVRHGCVAPTEALKTLGITASRHLQTQAGLSARTSEQSCPQTSCRSSTPPVATATRRAGTRSCSCGSLTAEEPAKARRTAPGGSLCLKPRSRARSAPRGRCSSVWMSFVFVSVRKQQAERVFGVVTSWLRAPGHFDSLLF